MNAGLLGPYDIQHNDTVWALIDGKPEQIRFHSILPYAGFRYWNVTGPCETRDPAEFARTREQLIDGHVAKREHHIAKLQTELAAFVAEHDT